MLNARSVQANPASICDWISSSNLRLVSVVETWHNFHDSLDLIACTPSGFNSIERARPLENAHDANMLINHGGICLFYHSTVHVKRIILADYLAFEYIVVYFTGSTLTLLFIALYHPAWFSDCLGSVLQRIF